MHSSDAAHLALTAIQGLTVFRDVPLSKYTRFAIGGPAAILADAATESAFLQALAIARSSHLPWLVIAAGTNLIASDTGFPGIVLRYTAATLQLRGNAIAVDAGALLQHTVDFSIAHGFDGLHTMTGIPGGTGAAIYGNAGAYGHSISEFIHTVRFFDGLSIREFDQPACAFTYRESIFKQHKDWIILSALLRLPAGDAAQLHARAADILAIRNAKYPPTMKCAGSIFKNLLLRELPPNVQSLIPPTVVKEGKVPSAWFLEQAGVKGLRRGDIQVATYHANLIYNDGTGSAADLCAVIAECKQRVLDRFGFPLEEEVQYVGF